MKTTFKFFAAALAIVAAVSCTKEGNNGRDESPVELVPVSFSATIDSPSDPSSPDKRTTLADDGLSVHWTEGDKICLFPYTGTDSGNASPYEGRNNPLTVDSESLSDGVALFEGTAVATSSGYYSAIYPFDALDHGNCYGNKYVFQSSTLSSQTAVANNFSKTSWGTANVAMAHNVQKDEILEFKNSFAHIMFSVAVSGVRTITLSAYKATSSDGTESVYSNLGSHLNYLPASDSFFLGNTSTKISLTNSGSDFEVGTIYYVAVPEVSMTDFTIEGLDSNSDKIFSFTKSSFSPKRNTIYNIGSLDATKIDELTFSVSALTIPAAGGTVTFTLTTNNPWTITPSQDWATVSPTSGEAGTHTITVTASANTTGAARIPCYLDTKSGTLERSIAVNQAKQTVKYTLGDRVPYATSLENGAYYVILRQGSSNEYWVNNNVTTGALSITGISDLTDIPVENIFIYHKDDSKKVTDDTSYGYTSGGAWQAINTNGYLNSDLCFTASSLSDAQYFTQGSHWGETDPNIDIYMKVWSTNGTAWSYKFISYVNYAIGLKTTSEVTNNNQRKWYVYKVDTVVSE